MLTILVYANSVDSISKIRQKIKLSNSQNVKLKLITNKINN